MRVRLKEKLNGAFASQNEKKIHFSSELEVSIETEDKKIPPYMGKCLVEILPQQIFAKLMKNPRFSHYNQHLFPKNTKTKVRR